jgi:hypothetical protein
MKPLSRCPTSPRKMRASDTRLGYEDGPKVIHRPSLPSPVASSPASRTAMVIERFLASGPRTRREVEHHMLTHGCEPDSFENALTHLGAVETTQMCLPGTGLTRIIALFNQFVPRPRGMMPRWYHVASAGRDI